MKNLLVAQSGGPSAAINATITGVIDAGIESGRVGHVYGALNGIKGVLNENFVNLDEVCDTKEKRDLLAITPAAALGSCRWKLGNPKENAEEFEEIIRILRKNDIGYFIYTGGNDSMDTVYKLSVYCEEHNIDDIKVMGAPKTIDNDLGETDHCPGFGSAAKFIATAFTEIACDCFVYDVPSVTIVEVMGRNAGYLALWCGIANGAEDVLIPEKYDYDEQKLINNIIESRKMGKKHHIIINAEGIGHSQAMATRIEAATGIETRATILGHMQRGGSPTCKDRVYASMMGAMAVDLLLEGKKSRVVGYRHGDFVDFDINEALAMEKSVTPYMWEVCESLSHNYRK